MLVYSFFLFFFFCWCRGVITGADGGMQSCLKPSHPPSGVDQNDSSDVYPMTRSPRGEALIINNRHFKTSNERIGTDVDSKALSKVCVHIFYQVKWSKQYTVNKITACYWSKGIRRLRQKLPSYQLCFKCNTPYPSSLAELTTANTTRA